MRSSCDKSKSKLGPLDFPMTGVPVTWWTWSVDISSWKFRKTFEGPWYEIFIPCGVHMIKGIWVHV